MAGTRRGEESVQLAGTPGCGARDGGAGGGGVGGVWGLVKGDRGIEG